jgi:hypothetical protein
MYLNTHNIIMTCLGNIVLYYYYYYYDYHYYVESTCGGCCGGRNNVLATHIVPTNYYCMRRPALVGEG